VYFSLLVIPYEVLVSRRRGYMSRPPSAEGGAQWLDVSPHYKAPTSHADYQRCGNRVYDRFLVCYASCKPDCARLRVHDLRCMEATAPRAQGFTIL